MAIPQQQSSSKKKPLLVKKKLLKKKTIVPVCNKVKKEEIDNERNLTIWESEFSAKTSGSAAMDRAIEVQAKLPSELPSCLKFMLKSHVTGGFWLSLPRRFCNLHLPKHDETVVLVDENNEEYSTKYLIGKNGLSGGWRGFSIAHNLLEGDVVIFQAVKPCVLKVYIVRANSLSEIDGAISLLNLDFRANLTDNDYVKNFNVTEQKKSIEPNTNNGHQEAIAMNALIAISADDVPTLDAKSENENESDLVPAEDHQPGNESDEFGSEILDGIRFSESVLDFKDVKDFESFSIIVDGLVIDSEIPKHLRTKYYELCCSRNSFLHEHVIKGLNCKLVAGIISETVNIADAIRVSKLDTSCDDLQTWDRTLKAFEDMGMAVGCLRDRIKKLVFLQCEEQEMIKSKTLERAQVETEKKNLEAELLRVKEVIKTLDAEIEALKMNNESLVRTFKEIATAPW